MKALLIVPVLLPIAVLYFGSIARVIIKRGKRGAGKSFNPYQRVTTYRNALYNTLKKGA